MFVYVAEFEDRAGLIKIGVAANVDTRMASLRSCHGAPTIVEEFNVGEDRYEVERFIHRKYKDKNIRLERCDGYTEFFDACIRDDVVRLLKGISQSLPASTAAMDSKLKQTRDIKAAPSIRQIESSLQRERRKMRSDACKANFKERLRVNKFLARVLYNGKQSEEQVSRLNPSYWTTLHYLGESVKLGVEIDHVLQAVQEQLVATGGAKLTRWRTKVFMSALLGRSTRMSSGMARVLSWNAGEEAEKIYLAMVLDGNNVDLSFIETLPLIEDRPGDSQLEKWRKRVYASEGFSEHEMVSIIRLRLQQNSLITEG